MLLECNLIKKYRPHYNVLFRDDKTYPYILITTDHPFPRIDFYRGDRKRNGLFFGPFPNAAAVKETIHFIEKLFQLRTCTDHFYQGRKRPCLQYQIGRCSGPCVGLIDQEEYQRKVKLAILFLQGKSEEILKQLNSQMEQAARELNYEAAANIRDQISQFREIQARQYVSAAEGEADVVGLAIKAGIVCIQLLIIRAGRILGSRTYFPTVPLQASPQEILMSFISQHYLAGTLKADEVPREIILSESLSDETWLASVLSEQVSHKVKFSANVRGERKKMVGHCK